MINYIVKDVDIFTKTANIYINGELVIEFGYNPNDPYRNVFDQIVNGSTPMHILDEPFPSIGMAWDGSTFLNGENGETFVQYIADEMPNCYFGISGLNLEAIVTINSENIVDGVLIMMASLWGEPNLSVEMLMAALMSNPTISIVDGAIPYPDFEIVGQIIQIQGIEDLEHLKPVDWQD